jgi:uncharacterized protein DUF4440
MTAPVAALVIVVSGWGALAVEGSGGKTDVEPELQSAMAARTKANLEGDTDKVESLMVEEYLQTDISGRVQSKSEWLAEYFKPLAALIKEGQFHWDVWEEKILQIRRFGDAVVMVGNLTLKGRGASPVPGRGWVASPQATLGPAVLHFTRLWVKRDGKWLLAAVHNATVPEQTKR